MSRNFPGNVQNPKSRFENDQIVFYTLGPLGYPSKSASLPRKEVGERYRKVRDIEGINFLPMGPLISRLGPSYVQKTANFNNRGGLLTQGRGYPQLPPGL